MTNEINHLIEVWEAHPPRVEPDDEAHMRYVFTQLLPALRDAMPDITRLTSQIPAPAGDVPSPSNAPSPEPEMERSIHSPVENQNTAGSDAGSGQTVGSAGTNAFLSASEIARAVDWRRDGTLPTPATKRPKKSSTRKPNAVPPAAPRGTGDTGKV